MTTASGGYGLSVLPAREGEKVTTTRSYRSAAGATHIDDLELVKRDN
jgi:hypothetical protein